jgi:hypothetical protein
MEFNVKKCKILRITKKQQPLISSFYLDNSILEEVKEFKDLGVKITLFKSSSSAFALIRDTFHSHYIQYYLHTTLNLHVDFYGGRKQENPRRKT